MNYDNVDAIQWTGSNFEEVEQWFNNIDGVLIHRYDHKEIDVMTQDRAFGVGIGDYIVTTAPGTAIVMSRQQLEKLVLEPMIDYLNTIRNHCSNDAVRHGMLIDELEAKIKRIGGAE
jgi:hypothetical protein